MNQRDPHLKVERPAESASAVIHFHVNRQAHALATDPSHRLSDVLRDDSA